MQKKKKMKPNDVEVKEETVYESTFIHLNTYQIMQILFLLDFCQQYLTYSILTLYYLLHLSSSACLAAPTSLWPCSFLFNPLKPMTRTCSSFFCVLLFFCKSCIYNKKTCSILVHAANLPKVMCLFEATLTATYYKTLLQLTY